MANERRSFEIGKLLSTRGVADRMQEDRQFAYFVALSLGRYMNCDWGELTDEDKAQNDEAVASGEDRIFASYTRKTGDGEETKFWIITEWDRSVTTILFPDEY
ncbi:MAG: hypothetical protein E7576_07005 [Ruminococcaceae bacterium]|nr:hypothetical protein [Oscillospiraceae bacterium]